MTKEENSAPRPGTIGILGTGHLAGFVCSGLATSQWAGQLVVSPHNPAKALEFQRSFDAVIAHSNQELLDTCELVFVAVRVEHVENALQGLRWRDGQVLLSGMAGVPATTLSQLAPDATIVRVMPLSSAALHQSPTLLYPMHSQVNELFSHLGSVIPLNTENEFDAATSNAAVYGWIVALINQLVDCNRNAGINAEQSLQIVCGTLAAAAGVVEQAGSDSSKVLQGLATPGGITAQGLDHLMKNNALEPWAEAFEQVTARLLPQN